jgi:hypothetical protein
MLEHIGEQILSANPKNLDDVLLATDAALTAFSQEFPEIVIAFVSAALNADGPSQRDKNAALLLHTTRLLQQEESDRAFFCSEMIFDDRLRAQLGPVPYDDLVMHWPRVLALGRIKEVVFMPGFRRSTGAMAEFEAAKKHGITRRILPE